MADKDEKIIQIPQSAGPGIFLPAREMEFILMLLSTGRWPDLHPNDYRFHANIRENLEQGLMAIQNPAPSPPEDGEAGEGEDKKEEKEKKDGK